MARHDYGNLFVNTGFAKGFVTDIIKKHGIESAYVNNGVYADPAEKIVPTTLAAFQFVADRLTDPKAALIIAANSTRSAENLMRLRIDKGEVKPEALDTLEPETVRGPKIGQPLSLQFPDRPVVVFYYEADTPVNLFRTISESANVKMRSIYKYGYGEEGQPIIEGTQFFDHVYAFALPNDPPLNTPPFAAGITRKTGQAKKAECLDLREVVGPHGTPYLSKDMKCLFPLRHPELQRYAATPAPR